MKYILCVQNWFSLYHLSCFKQNALKLDSIIMKWHSNCVRLRNITRKRNISSHVYQSGHKINMRILYIICHLSVRIVVCCKKVASHTTNHDTDEDKDSGISIRHMRSSFVITRSNSVIYYITNYRNSDRISIRYWFQKRHPISRPNGRAMTYILRKFMRKVTAL